MTLTSLSEVPISDDCVVVFDLDDTLCPERDFVLSGFRAIELEIGQPVFERLRAFFDSGEKDAIGRVLSEIETDRSKNDLIQVYRKHLPDLNLSPEIQTTLTRLKNSGHPLGIVTDGRSQTQRNKIRSLGLEDNVDEIVVSEEFGSEKPDPRNFQVFETKFPGRSYAYIGDNVRKDFIAPNELGWITVCLLDRGQNIHSQNFDGVPKINLPTYRVQSLA